MLKILAIVIVIWIVTLYRKQKNMLAKDACLKKYIGKKVRLAIKNKYAYGYLRVFGGTLEISTENEENVALQHKNAFFYDSEINQSEIIYFQDNSKELHQKHRVPVLSGNELWRALGLQKTSDDEQILARNIMKHVLIEVELNDNIFSRSGMLTGYSDRFIELCDVLIMEEETLFLSKKTNPWIICEDDAGVLKIKNLLDEDIVISKLEGLDFRRDIQTNLPAKSFIDISLDNRSIDDLVLSFFRRKKADILLPRLNCKLRHLIVPAEKKLMQNINTDEKSDQQSDENQLGHHNLFT